MHTHPALHLPWRVLVGTVGTVVILAGLVMMVFPGPGVAALLLGLVILSTEFRWANSLVRPVRVWSRRVERFGHRKKDEYLARWRTRRAARARRTPPRPRPE
ncbi:PGPGW domain-containing protein [Nocardiopsis aegyptia]|uniref:PGPGW domain-containing protein n=1 Tax=Nocardiopsis aegyptia TaxID=220378 RepID=UPI00366FA045